METKTDERGEIKDLAVTDNYSVTHITFTKGAVRGNHYHKETEQVDIILKGKLVCAQDDKLGVVKAGQVVLHGRGVKHAYSAIGDAEILSVCFGVRRGENYEKDTFRLDDNDKLL